MVVDCDLKNYFDTIHHQRLRAYLEEFISDKIALKLIWKFLRSGILDKDIYIETKEVLHRAGYAKLSINHLVRSNALCKVEAINADF